MRLEGNQIYLRLLCPDDASSEYAAWLNDPLVNQYLESRWKHYTVDDVRSYIASVNDGRANFLFGMFESASGRHIGNIKLGGIHPVYRYGDIGLLIGDRQCHGKGIGTEAIRLCCRAAFECLNLHKVTAGLYQPNMGSLRSFEKNGFRQVGTWRQHVFVGGSYVDVLLVELLREEFRP